MLVTMKEQITTMIYRHQQEFDEEEKQKTRK